MLGVKRIGTATLPVVILISVSDVCFYLRFKPHVTCVHTCVKDIPWKMVGFFVRLIVVFS